jgi:hypothetical protein
MTNKSFAPHRAAENTALPPVRDQAHEETILVLPDLPNSFIRYRLHDQEKNITKSSTTEHCRTLGFTIAT